MEGTTLIPVSSNQSLIACQAGVQAQMDYWDLIQKEAEFWATRAKCNLAWGVFSPNMGGRAKWQAQTGAGSQRCKSQSSIFEVSNAPPPAPCRSHPRSEAMSNVYHQRVGCSQSRGSYGGMGVGGRDGGIKPSDSRSGGVSSKRKRMCVRVGIMAHTFNLPLGDRSRQLSVSSRPAGSP